MASNQELDAQYGQIAQTDPVLRQIYAQMQQNPPPPRGDAGHPTPEWIAYMNQYAAPLRNRLTQLGIDPKSWRINVNPDGSLGVDHQNWLERHPTAASALPVIAAGGIAAPYIFGAMSGGGAAGAGSAATGSGATAGATPAAAAGGGIAAGEGAGTAGTTAAAGGKLAALGNFLKSPLGEALVTGGLITGGNYLENRAKNQGIDKALAAQQAGTDKALKISGDVYNEQRRDFQNLANVPYQTLGQLLGMNIPSIGPSSAVPSGMPPGPVGPMAGQHAGDYVSGMVAPRAPLPPGFPSLAELNPPDRMTLGELVRPRTATANQSGYRKAAAR